MTHILVDFSNLAHRIKYAVKGDADTKGSMAIHVCFNAIAKAWKQFNGSHVIVCLEGANSWRKIEFSDYKAHRIVTKNLRTPKEQEDDEIFFEYMNEFTTFLKNKTNITVLQTSGCEADDLIARWIQLHPDVEHVIISSDTDFYQLLSENVKIYNGVKNENISLADVVDDDNNPVQKSVKKLDDNGKIMKDAEGKSLMEEKNKPAPDPEWELFKKIMRGDPGDNVFRACEKGLRETKLKEAYDERHQKGYFWNNLMQSNWVDHNGEDKRVQERYNFNAKLIDLSKQPEEIIKLMDTVIVETVQEEHKQNVGIWLMKFCHEFDLKRIEENSKNIIPFLNSGYEG